MIQPLSFSFKLPDSSKSRDWMLLRSVLSSLGERVGRRPAAFLVPALLLGVASCLAVFLLPHKIDQAVDNAYYGVDSPARRAIESQISFFSNNKLHVGGEVKPWYMGLFAEPRSLSTGSMLNTEEYGEFSSFYKNAKAEIVISSNGLHNFTFLDYCGEMCDLNQPFFSTMGLHGLSFGYMDLYWPVSNVMGFNANIGKHFFKRTENEDGSLADVDLSALYFMLFINGTEMKTALENFEQKVYERVNAHNSRADVKTRIIAYSEVGMSAQIKAGIFEAGSYAGVGAALLFFCLLFATLLELSIHSRFSCRSIWIFLTIPLLAAAASASAFAVCSILSLPFNALMFMTPAVSIALNVDGALHLLHAWLTADREKTYSDNASQLAYIFEHPLSSVLINCLSLGPLLLCALLPVEALANLGVTIALIGIFSTFYLVFLFTPALVLLVPHVRHERVATKAPLVEFEMTIPEKLANGNGHNGDKEVFTESGIIQPRSTCLRLVCQRFCCIFSSVYTAHFVIRLISVTLVCAALATTTYTLNQHLESNMDYRDLLSPDSPAHGGAGIMTDTVWPDLLHIIFFVEKPPNFGDPEQYAQFMSFLNESSSLPSAMGKEADMNWIYDFKLHNKVPDSADRLNMTLFREFIDHHIYKAWRSGVQYTIKDDGSPSIDRMIVMVAFNGTRSLNGKQRLINQCREVAAKYPQFDLVSFDTEVAMVDVLNELPLYVNGAPIALAMAIFPVFLVFSQNAAAALAAALPAFALNYFIFGVAVYNGLVINPFTSGFLFIVFVLAGRLSIHLTFHFHETGIYQEKGEDVRRRAGRTVRHAALPTLFSSLFGVLLLLPLYFSPIPMFPSFGSLAALHLGLGLIFSFILLPQLLTLIPRQLIGSGWIYTSN